MTPAKPSGLFLTECRKQQPGWPHICAPANGSPGAALSIHATGAVKKSAKQNRADENTGD
jgi:hypothetical protein